MKKLSIKDSPLEISCSFKDFSLAYIDAKLHHSNSSLEFLLSNLYPNFLFWEHLILTNSYSENITTSTLVTLLKMDDKPKAKISWKLTALKQHLSYNNLSFTDLCVDAFLRHIKKETKVYSSYSNQFKLLFFINKEIKTFLFKIIRSILQQEKRDYYTNPSYNFNTCVYTDIHIDYILLSNIKNENPLLFSAFVYYITVDQKFPNIKKHFKLTDNEYLSLKEDLCQLIETLLSSS